MYALDGSQLLICSPQLGFVKILEFEKGFADVPSRSFGFMTAFAPTCRVVMVPIIGFGAQAPHDLRQNTRVFSVDFQKHASEF